MNWLLNPAWCCGRTMDGARIRDFLVGAYDASFVSREVQRVRMMSGSNPRQQGLLLRWDRLQAPPSLSRVAWIGWREKGAPGEYDEL